MAPVVHDTETITTDDGAMGVHISRPHGDGPFPVVLFFHRGPGFDDGSWWAMDQFADAGYLVVAPDRYYREETWPWIDTTALRAAGPDSDLKKRFHHMLDSTTEVLVARDVTALLAALAANPLAAPAPMVAVGYCIGARTVLRSMTDHPDLVVAGAALQPSQCVTADAGSPHLLVSGLRGSLYVAIGAEDTHAGPEVSAPLIDAVHALGDRGVVEVYDGAVHGFTLPGEGFDPASVGPVYEQTLATFTKALA